MKQQKITILIFFLVCTNSLFSGDFTIGPRIITKKGIWSNQTMLLHIAFTDPSRFTTLFNSLAYGLTENTGFQITIPIIFSKLNNLRGTGLGNIRLLGQWQFYKRPSNTGVFNAEVRIPTRTVKPINLNPLAVASYSFDITCVHSSDNWYAWTRDLMQITPEHRNLKPGNLFFYVLGAGPKIHIRKTSLSSLLELRGGHTSDSALNDALFPSGGHTLFLGPHFILKKKNILAEMVFGMPISQHIDSPERTEWFCFFTFQVDF